MIIVPCRRLLAATAFLAHLSRRDCHAGTCDKMMQETSADALGIGNDLENWMGQLPETLKNVNFFHLAIPGSHNSLTYCLTPARRVAPDAPESVQFLARVFGSLARRIVCNWSVTQRASVLEQLRGGIRYLDIRLAMTAGLQNPVVAHGLYGEEVGPLLALVDTFLASHPGEVLVLDFQHFYDFTAADHSRLISVLQDLFGPRLCPYWPGAPVEISLRWLCAHGYQIILVYRCDNGRRCAGMWPGETIPTPWPNTTNISALLGILQRGLEARDMRRGHIAQCLLTPKPATVMCSLGGLCGSLERQLVRPCNDAVIPWLTKQRPGSKRSSLNIAIADFVARDSPFAATVIQLNAKLLDLPSLVSSPVSIKA